jgi:hypothetical protein
MIWYTTPFFMLITSTWQYLNFHQYIMTESSLAVPTFVQYLQTVQYRVSPSELNFSFAWHFGHIFRLFVNNPPFLKVKRIDRLTFLTLTILLVDLSKLSQCSQYPCCRKQKKNKIVRRSPRALCSFTASPIQLLY